MPRNVATSRSGVCNRKIWMVKTGALYTNSNFNTIYESRRILRPDVVKVPKVNGFRKPTAWSVDDNSNTTFVGSVTYFEGSGAQQTRTVWSDFHTGPATFQVSLPSDNILNRAEVECLLKIKDQRVNVSVAAAESIKTISMIKDRVTAVARAAIYVKHGKIAKAAKALGYRPSGNLKASGKGVSSDWLELQYGWLPLLSDIYGGYEEIRKKTLTYGEVITAKRTIQSESPLTGTESHPSPLANGYEIRYDGSIKYLTKVSLSYKVNNVALQQAATVGALNPLTVLWEITPFSFLIDWILPIGNYIEAVDATAGLTFIGGSATRVARGSRNATMLPKVKNAQGMMSASQTSFMMRRTAYSSSPIPAPYYKSPVSGLHALNAIALLRTIL